MKQAEPRSVLAGRTQAERRRVRKGISLRESGITDRTRQRYHHSLLAILPFLEQLTSFDDLGRICEEWIELQWETGSPLGLVGDALCALQFYWGATKLCLRPAWKLYHNWRKLEIPCRAPPMSALIARAFVSHLVQLEEVAGAFLIAVGFHCYLRTGELLRLRFCDLHVTGGAGVVSVQASKSGLRHNISEAVAIYDPMVQELAQLCRLLPHFHFPTDQIWPHSSAAFRTLFGKCVSTFQLHPLGYKPYSLRRGGATHDYIQRGTLDSIILRGRWRSLGVARLYLEDGLAQYPSLTLSPAQLQMLHTAARPFSSLFL